MLHSLGVMQVCTTPSVFFTQGDKRTVGEPPVLVEKTVVHEIAVAFFFVERVRDSRFGIAGENLHLRLVSIDTQDEQFTCGRPTQAREIEIIGGLRFIVGHLHGLNAFGSDVIDADGRLGIRTSGFRVTQTLLGRILRLSVNIPTETRYLVLVEPYESQHFGIRTPGKERRCAELLFIKPIGDAGDDIRVLVFGYRHFGSEIEFVDI